MTKKERNTLISKMAHTAQKRLRARYVTRSNVQTLSEFKMMLSCKTDNELLLTARRMFR